MWVNGEEQADPSAVELGQRLEGPVSLQVRQRGFRPFESELAADVFEVESERRFHRVQVQLERLTVQRPRPASTTPAPVPAPEPEGPVPSNPF